MHRVFRQALTDAVGRSEFVIVVVADIRGFSAFSRERESPDTAMYIKRVYSKLIDEYFSSASFYKPTGDGLLVTIPYNEKNLTEVANQTVDSCLTCLKQFPSICADDNMINFSVPNAIGFGVARGTACCLYSGETILDYSGHLLNLASRLMNLARPSGVVIDGSFKIELLTDEKRKLFDQTEVYVRSLAEQAPMKICYSKAYTKIQEEAKTPLARESWETWRRTEKLSHWPKLGPVFRILLPRLLKSQTAAEVSYVHPSAQAGKRVKGVTRTQIFNEWRYEVTGGVPRLVVQIDQLVKDLLKLGVPKSTPVTLEARYVLVSQ